VHGGWREREGRARGEKEREKKMREKERKEGAAIMSCHLPHDNAGVFSKERRKKKKRKKAHETQRDGR
jgi:hypothetical protein